MVAGRVRWLQPPGARPFGRFLNDSPSLAQDPAHGRVLTAMRGALLDTALSRVQSGSPLALATAM
jgi:hypothetical protein